jgi:hypothetical protein
MDSKSTFQYEHKSARNYANHNPPFLLVRTRRFHEVGLTSLWFSITSLIPSPLRVKSFDDSSRLRRQFALHRRSKFRFVHYSFLIWLFVVLVLWYICVAGPNVCQYGFSYLFYHHSAWMLQKEFFDRLFALLILHFWCWITNLVLF